MFIFIYLAVYLLIYFIYLCIRLLATKVENTYSFNTEDGRGYCMSILLIKANSSVKIIN